MSEPEIPFRKLVQEFEAELLMEAAQKVGYLDWKAMAGVLGIERHTVAKKARRYQIARRLEEADGPGTASHE